MKVGKLTLRFK